MDSLSACPQDLVRLKAELAWSLRKRMLSTLLRIFAGRTGSPLGLLRNGRVQVRRGTVRARAPLAFHEEIRRA